MKHTPIPERRKHIYFYTLLVLGALALANLKSTRSEAAPATRAAAANQLANTLFQ